MVWLPKHSHTFLIVEEAFHLALLYDVELVALVTLVKNEFWLLQLDWLKAVYQFQFLKFVNLVKKFDAVQKFGALLAFQNTWLND